MNVTGIIDIGSNSMRLSIIASLQSGAYYVLDEQKASPRLSQQIKRDGAIAEDAIRDLIEKLQGFIGLCRAHHATRIEAVGTAALRAAKNRAEIVERIERETGIHVEVIPGVEEAALGFSAVANTMKLCDALLVDIGGGSTEVTLVRSGAAIASHSFPIGAVTANRDLGQLSREQMMQRIQTLFPQVELLTQAKNMELIGIGGTIRTIARVHQGLSGYPLALTHNYFMQQTDVEETVAYLGDIPLARRKKVEGLSKDRADLIVPGGMILLSLMRYTASSVLRISGRGLRDGTFFTRVLGTDNGLLTEGVLETSVHNLLERCRVPIDHAKTVTHLALAIATPLCERGDLDPARLHLLYAAAMLHRVGIHIHYYDFDRHTFYLILNGTLYGLTHRELLMVAAAASYKGRNRTRKQCAPFRTLLSEDDLTEITKIGVIVRLAEALDRRHEKRVSAVRLKTEKKQAVLYVHADEGDLEYQAANDLLPLFRKAFGFPLSISSEKGAP
ncbi:Ppx/GppA phosphatase family protein [Ferroacidibacillus organovorans]|uniref:Uncharacterized protein n=1 Tax=Ferroacidibacillus organovorans TaxID=1765683 RepID=A0A1V4ES88_9BACL|nr:Ppx/GppA phosphatase family protein [Ferroacidibacillus organovorans]OPG15799.1 hypothetical protein B2M26_09285 [Ferroacidibacillus organovorans]